MKIKTVWLLRKFSNNNKDSKMYLEIEMQVFCPQWLETGYSVQ